MKNDPIHDLNFYVHVKSGHKYILYQKIGNLRGNGLLGKVDVAFIFCDE